VHDHALHEVDVGLGTRGQRAFGGRRQLFAGLTGRTGLDDDGSGGIILLSWYVSRRGKVTEDGENKDMRERHIEILRHFVEREKFGGRAWQVLAIGMARTGMGKAVA
jgi:hypothetical protein